MDVSFAKGAWENAGMTYAYSWRFPDLPRFRQEADCVVNTKRSDKPMDFDYVGFLAPGIWAPGAKITVRTAFEDGGAPMLLLSGENEIDENGVLRTLEYYEIVIWKNGLNVWRHHTEGRETSYYLTLGAAFPLSGGEEHILTMNTRPDRMLLDVDGRKLNLFIHDMPPSFRLGYTACEGYCRLYGMRIEQ